jgi:hypothetical protein
MTKIDAPLPGVPVGVDWPRLIQAVRGEWHDLRPAWLRHIYRPAILLRNVSKKLIDARKQQ